MQPEDRIRVEHMLDACRSVSRFLAGRQRKALDEDEMLRFALVRAIEIIGEAASKVSPEGRQQMTGVPWREAIGIRNRLVHAYFDIDLDVLWKTATTAIPELSAQLETILGAR
jgi:uncharacterized protein with HEPN domain